MKVRLNPKRWIRTNPSLMKTSTNLHHAWLHFLRAGFLVGTFCLLGISTVRAGFNLEMNVFRYNQNGYYFYAVLTTNTALPDVPFGDYYLASPDAPTNGASAYYHFTTNGFNQFGGVTWAYGDFDSMKHELTNGTWSISVTNAATTN